MGKSGRKSLKSALLSQQSRLKKRKASQVAEEREKKNAQTKGKGKASSHGGAPEPVIPFYPTDRILLIGEGNFSFARALVMHPPKRLESLPPVNVTATTYDTEEECRSKYPDAQDTISSLREKGVEVLFEVDATKLEKCPSLKGRRWNRVVWNFPHAGE
jgi:25S rRNA (uracil2634-N3)-methyltransferase